MRWVVIGSPLSPVRRRSQFDPLLPLSPAPPTAGMPRLRPFSRGPSSGAVGQFETVDSLNSAVQSSHSLSCP